MKRVLADARAHFRTWARSPTAVFFTLAFPVILIAIFGAIFSGNGGTLPLLVQDQDGTQASADLVDALNGTGVLEVTMLEPGVDAVAETSERDEPALLIVPEGYQAALARGDEVTIEMWTDPTREESRRAVATVQLVVSELNVRLTGSEPRVQVANDELPRPDGGLAGDYVAYLVPGIVGMSIATTALIGGLEQAATLRENGILRRLVATPLTRLEYVMSKALYQVIIGLVSAAAILVTSYVLFDVTTTLGWRSILVLLLAPTAFAGLAMVLARWVDRPDQANAAGSAIVFPMLFLSGAFFPIATMPGYLQTIAELLPLTWVNEALRAALITGRLEAFRWYTGLLAAFTLAMLLLGAWLTEWKEV